RNPLGGSAKVSNQADMSTIYGSAYEEYDILDNLNLKSKLSFYLSNEHVSNFATSFSNEAVFDIYYTGKAEATIAEQKNKTSTKVWTNTLNYKGQVAEKHLIDAVFGLSWDQSRTDLQSQTYKGFPDDFNLTDIRSATKVSNYDSQSIQSGLNSIFGRINYNYDERYLVTFTARRDGSTKFGPNNKFGFFPSGAVAWNMQNEEFMKNIEMLSQMKFRV